MAVAIFEGIVKAFEGLVSLCNKTADASNSEKYAQSVQALNQNVDETYAEIRDLITNDATLSTDEKIEKLNELAKSQLIARQSCEEAIKGNRENVTQIIGEILLAFSTCGISYAPKLLTKTKKDLETDLPLAVETKNEPKLLEEKE